MAGMNDIFTFLDGIAANNNRTWFAEHRSEYEAARQHFIAEVQTLIDLMAHDDPTIAHVDARDCMYRIYRDTRFSTNKTPYKTHMGAYITPQGRHSDRAGYYFHLGHEDNVACAGLWCPEPRILKKVRKAIIDNVEEFRSITETPDIMRLCPDWWGEKLKTVPQGYDRNHPDIDLLRLKEYNKVIELPRSFFSNDGWQKEVAQYFAMLRPLNEFLNYSIDE